MEEYYDQKSEIFIAESGMLLEPYEWLYGDKISDKENKRRQKLVAKGEYPVVTPEEFKAKRRPPKYTKKVSRKSQY